MPFTAIETDEQDEKEGQEVIRACNKAWLGTWEVEAAFQTGDDCVDDTVNNETLDGTEQTHPDNIYVDLVEELKAAAEKEIQTT